MPKRSNAFQQVVHLLNKQLNEGAQVTESKLLKDSSTGKLREVDIVIEASAGVYPVVVSIECAHYTRPVTVEWV